MFSRPLSLFFASCNRKHEKKLRLTHRPIGLERKLTSLLQMLREIKIFYLLPELTEPIKFSSAVAVVIAMVVGKNLIFRQLSLSYEALNGTYCSEHFAPRKKKPEIDHSIYSIKTPAFFAAAVRMLA